MNKYEVLLEHNSTWKTNGLNTLDYVELSQTECGHKCIRIIVDVKLNNHWTDNYIDINNVDCVVKDKNEKDKNNNKNNNKKIKIKNKK
jgi:hypothetical protein